MLARKSPWFVCLIVIILVACQTKEIEVTRVVTEKETVIETVIETVVQKETVIEVVTATPEPEPESERTLVICTRSEPDTLYGFYPFGRIATSQVLAAVYDGPFDTRSFAYQPVILEKTPSLEDGDVVFETVTVEAGDPVMDDTAAPVILEQGTVVRPAGCYSSDCAVAFDGTPLEMEQMIVAFKLKQGITWSDGEPLTASDSVYGFELIRDPDTPTLKWLANSTASYEVIDDRTTVFSGLPGFRSGGYLELFFPPRPEHVWGDLTALELLEVELSTREPLGWGPYVIDEWVAGDHITLSRNGRYWRADEGLPLFDRLIYRFMSDSPGAGLAALLSGECDILDGTHQLGEQSELLLELQSAGKLNASFVLGERWENANFGMLPAEDYARPNFFGDVRTRQAIAHCMDRQRVVDTVLSGQSVVLDTYVVPNHPFHNPAVARYRFDVARGSALLDEVGWIDDDGDPTTPRVARGVTGVRNGTLLTFNYWTTTSWQRQRAAQVLQASLAECGIKVDLEYWNPDQFFANSPGAPVWGRRYDMAQYAWPSDTGCEAYITDNIPGDPEATDRNGVLLYPQGWYGPNNAGFSNPEFDVACDAVWSTVPGTAEHRQRNMEAQRIYAEQLPSVPLYASITVYATRPDLTGFVPDPSDYWGFWNIEEYDYVD